MDRLSRSTHLLIAAVLVVDAAARIPCAAHQSVDGLGGNANQPNVITQSVTWSPSKKGQIKPLPPIDADGPINGYLVDPPSRSINVVSSPRYRQTDGSEMENDMDIKINRLVRMLNNIQHRDAEDSERVEYNRKRYRPRKYRLRRFEQENEYPEVKDVESNDFDDEYEDVEIERRPPRRLRRMRYQRYFDDQEDEPSDPPKRGSRMDWLILKKTPKRVIKRWSREEDESPTDTRPSRDILYIPRGESKEKLRRRITNEYS